MPAINVAKTDTFELQRQKINGIGQQIFTISEGGSDLSTGNLKLGDGTRTDPSLAFVSDPTLGIYKSAQKTFGLVSNQKLISEFSDTGSYSFLDFYVQKKSIKTTNGIILLDSGFNYDPGTYTNIILFGGSGSNAEANVTVTSNFTGLTINSGSNYNIGSYVNIQLIGGSGSGATASFVVIDYLLGAIVTLSISTATIIGEEDDAEYLNISGISSGSGTGATFNITRNNDGEIETVSIVNGGQNYIIGEQITINGSNIGGTSITDDLIITVSSVRETLPDYSIGNFNIVSFGTGYKTNDTLSLPKPVLNVSTNLGSQVQNLSTNLNNTVSTVTLSSTTGIVTGMLVTQDDQNDVGILAPNTTVLSVDSSTQITLSIIPEISGSATLTFTSGGNLSQITVSSTNEILSGFLVTQTSGSGILATNTTVVSVNTSENIITLSQQPTLAGTATLNFSPSFGDPLNDFEYGVTLAGNVSSLSISSTGFGYSLDDILTINSQDLVSPITYQVFNKSVVEITFTNVVPIDSFSVGSFFVRSGDLVNKQLFVYKINSSGGNITSVLIDYDVNITVDSTLLLSGNVDTSFDLNTVSSLKYRFFIDTGSGLQLTPSFTLIQGNNYIFNFSDQSNSLHSFSLSEVPGGIWGNGLVQNVSTTLNNLSFDIEVSDSTAILPGMVANVTSGSGILSSNTKVISVSGTTVTLDKLPLASGSVVLRFTGVEYTDGVVKSSTQLILKVTDNTPDTLYYYCSIHEDEGGEKNQEAIITIDKQNPKILGDGLTVQVIDLDLFNVIVGDVSEGTLTAIKHIGQQAEFGSTSVTGTLTAPTIAGNAITATTITSSGNLALSATAVNVTGNFNVGSNIQIVSSTGDITTSGVLRTNSSLNVNNILTITDNTISTSDGNNLILSPPTGRVAKVNATTALTIPVGSSVQRPASNVVENGAIRFNTDTNQYEGYSATTTSWSSLGGVRDLDGNTYIAAEAFTGANDNTLYFFNDNNNTLKLTTSYLDFNTVKKLRSLSTSLPTFTNWASNTPVLLDSYVKYRNNLYLVTTAGTTGTSGNEPTHTTGSQPNGTAVLEWYISAVAPLTFEEISELQVGPVGNLPLVINSDLRLANNVISTDVEDLVLRPNSGKKLTIDAATSLVIPAGDNDNRGNPSQGSIRFNTTSLSFEGYSGTNWTSLGGVKDVDGNTYIIPETLAGANENILYFFNDGENTLQLSKTALNFQTISRITSTSDTLEINAELVSFDSFAASIDNSGTTTFISSTKDNLDLGLSVGLVNSHLLRLNTSGDIIVNKGFGTASPENIKVLDNELKDFELDDVKVSTGDISLIKGTTNTGSTILYSPTTAKGIKVVVSAYNNTTNDVEMVEFTVTDKGSDIFNSEYGNIATGDTLVDITFDFNASNNVRMNFSLNTSVQTGNQVNITVVKTIIKK